MADNNVSRRHDDLDGESRFSLDREAVEFKHRGAWGETAACLWLLQNGYEVFRNISSHGLCDIVAIKGDEILKFDVKTSSFDLNTYLSKTQTDMGIKLLRISDSNNIRILDGIKDIPEKANCVVCGKEFRPTKKGNTRCTPHCQTTNMLMRDCKFCGKPFIRYKKAHVFCTNACRNSAYVKNKRMLLENAQ